MKITKKNLENMIREEVAKAIAEDVTLTNTRPKYEMKGKMIVATIEKDGKSFVGKAKIRGGNIGMAKTSAAARARQQMARAMASTSKDPE